MEEQILAIANCWQLWACCALIVVLVLAQNALYLRLCGKEARRIGYPVKYLGRAVGNGMVTSVGPALAGVVVMISMMALVGNPLTWYRLSIIGAAQTELTVATLGADAIGAKLGTATFGVMALTYAAFLFAFNGNGWLFCTAVLTGSMEKVRLKLSGGDMTWLNLLSAGCTLGVFTYLTAAQMIRIVPIGGAKSNPGPFAAAIGAFAIQYSLDRWVAPKAKWIKSYAITFALIGGLVLGYIIRPV
jgi:hypothetical protein